MSKKQGRNKDDSWRSLTKRAAGKKIKSAAGTWRARLRLCGRIMRWVAAVALAAAVSGGIWFACKTINFGDFIGGNNPPLRAIEFKSDGVITAHWLGNILCIPKNSTLADVNIFEIKRALEDVSQIEFAKVEREYPDILRIEIRELKPVAKISVKVDFKPVDFLVAEDGTYFRPICYDADALSKLITLEGVKFVSGGKFENVEKFKLFVSEAKKVFPSEVEKWESADFSQADSLALPLVLVRTKGGTRIVFNIAQLQKQFEKFSYILRYLKDKSLNDFETVDLSLKDRADAKLKSRSR